MTKAVDAFMEASEGKTFDLEHRRKLKFNIGQYDKKVQEGKHQYSNLELAKSRAANLKTKVIENLDAYLIEFEANFIKRGGKVIWAQDSEEAIREVLQIMKKVNAKTVVKAKSMTTEEVHFNES